MSLIEEVLSKQELVQAISDLTNSGVQTVGPGSKEHKSVLINLANGVGLRIKAGQTKQDLASSLAKFFGINWQDSYYSTGQTITSEGLAALLDAAKLWISQNGLVKFPYQVGEEFLRSDLHAQVGGSFR